MEESLTAKTNSKSLYLTEWDVSVCENEELIPSHSLNLYSLIPFTLRDKKGTDGEGGAHDKDGVENGGFLDI